MAARRDGRDDRVEYARERAAELEPKLSRLTLLLAPGVDEPELTLELDGANIGRAVLGAATPVDPGKHVVRVSAPGKAPWEQSIEIGSVADQQSLTIPKLELLPEQPAPPPAAGPLLEPAPAPSPIGPRDELPRPIPTSVYVAGGLTLACVTGAAITGLVYLNKRQDHTALAGRPGASSDEIENSEQSALRYGYVNIGLWAGAAIGASVTTYLFVTRPAHQQTARVLPWAAPGNAGLSVQGGF